MICLGGFLAGIQNPWKPLSFTLKYISCLERKFEIQKESYSTHSNAQYPMQMSSTVRSESIDFHVANLYVSSKTLLETRYPHIIFHSHFMFIEILTLFLILLYLDSININIYRNENRVVLNRMGWINTVPLTNWKLGLFVLLISRMKIHTYKQNAFHEPIENP